MLVNEFLESSAEALPEKVALIYKDYRLTFSEVEKKANQVANALKEKGLHRQERAAIYLDNSVESVISIFGIAKAGGVFLVINPQVKANKIKYILNDCQTKVLITDKNHLKEVENVLSECPDLRFIILTDTESQKDIDRISFSEILHKYPTKRPLIESIDIDLACLIYTSGSTGIPKGVMCTHQNVASAASSIIEYLENTPDDIILNVLPLSFDYGLYQALMSFKFGGTLILERSFLYPYPIIDLLIKEKATGFPLVPTMAAILLKLKGLEKYDFSGLRYISNTAQALPPQHITQLQKIFSKTKIYSMYGLTECKRVSYLPPDELKKRPASVGIAMPNTEVYIVDENGNKITQAGEIGELIVRGANVMRGYWNLPEETEKVYRPGPIPGEKVLYTGDYFKMDEEGFLYFVSRMDNMIKTAGERVSPKEIENVLYNLKGVNEAAIIGIDDEILGQAIKAFVSLKEDSELTTADILRFCSKNMESFMIPKYIEIWDELPKSSHGKIDKKKLV